MKIEKQNKKVFKVSFEASHNTVDYIIATNLSQAKILADKMFANRTITKVEKIIWN